MPPQLPFNFRTLPPIYYALYWFAVSTFAAANVTALPLLDSEIAATLFSLLMQISSGLMAIVEVMELVVQPVPRWSTPICFINLLGLSCYFYSSLKYEEFNKGQLYLLGAFSFSLGYELKFLAIIVQQGRSMATIIRQEMFKFIRFGCMIVGTLLFLGGSVLIQLDKEQQWGSGVLSLSGGVISALSAFFLFKKPSHIGYARFQQEMEIPTIV